MKDGSALHGAGFIELPGRTKLQFSGPQALWFLDQLVTNKVVDLAAGSVAEALLLTPNGRITAVLRILATDDGALLDADPGQAAPLMEFFQMRVFATKVAISDVSAGYSTVRVVGESVTGPAHRLLGIPAGLAAAAKGGFFEAGFAAGLAEPEQGMDLWLQSGREDDVAAMLAEAGAADLSAGEYDNMRVVAGVPWFGRDFDETFLPQEAAMEKAVHFEKGCYLGQEAVAMTQRGRIKRRLRHLHFNGPAVRGELRYQDRQAGAATSTGAAEGRSYAIATVKTAVPVGAEVEVAGDSQSATATVHELPGTTTGPHVPSARELRERLQSR